MLNLQRQVCAEAYRAPVKFAVLLQVGIGILCVLMLDGGVLARVCACAVLAFWAGAALILVRRPYEPTRFDLAMIRYGFVSVFVMAVLWAQHLAFIP
jgi:hypothetical protein